MSCSCCALTGPEAAAAAKQHDLELEEVKLPIVRCGFVLLARRRVVERSVPTRLTGQVATD